MSDQAITLPSIYPSWRYHRSGKAILVHHPDHEPQGQDWGRSPFPQPAPEPKLPECCQKLKERFDAAWDKRTAEYERLKNDHTDVLARFEDQWTAKVQENAELQAQIDALKADAPLKAQLKPDEAKAKKK